MSEDVKAAAERLIDLGELYERLFTHRHYSADLLLVGRFALEAADRQAALALELGRVKAALCVLLTHCRVHEQSARLVNQRPWYVATVPDPLEEARVALDAAPAVAPGASDAASSLSCDACGDPITEDYIETLVEGDTGEYHVACAPPGMPRRTVLVAPGAEDAGKGD